MAKDRVPQNAVGGGEKEKGKVKPERLGGGVSFEELMRQEKGNRDRAALRYNAATGNRGSTAYSPPKPAPAATAPMQTAGIPKPAAAPALPASPPIPSARPATGPIYEPGGGYDPNLGLPMPGVPQLAGIPPDLNMPPMAPQLNSIPPDLNPFAMPPPVQGVPPALMAQAIPARFGRPDPKGPRLGPPPFAGV